MKFIYADCLDTIDPQYDFINDLHGEGRVKYWDDRFAHEYMDRPPYDGILVSRGIVGDHLFNGKYTESEAMRFRRDGARKFLRYSEEKFPDGLVFGDCGAFQYVRAPEPPYTPEDMIEFYDDGGFTHGCSIDHIIFDFDPSLDQEGPTCSRISEDAKQRYEITLDLAEKFFKVSRQIRGKFTPLGVIQGWSPQSMARAAQSLVRMGYGYLAVGGLVPLKVDEIHQALSAIREVLSPEIKIHLLGFAKADQLAEFVRYKIAGFDSSSPMIRAFKDDRRNYYLKNGKGSITYFKAVRIPQATENNTLRKKIRTGKCSQEDMLAHEAKCLSRIRRYADHKAGLEETVVALREYSEVLLRNDNESEDRNNARVEKLCNEYTQTLSARPWEKCRCRACRECGVEVIIFRSSNRNKRRGMHNLAVFYEHLQELRR